METDEKPKETQGNPRDRQLRSVEPEPGKYPGWTPAHFGAGRLPEPKPVPQPPLTSALQKLEALLNVGNAVVPVRLVLHEEAAREFLAAQLSQDLAHVQNTRTEDLVRGRLPDLQTVLDVQVDDAPLKSTNSLDWHHPGGCPVPRIDAGTDSGVAIFDEFQDELGIPEPVALVFRIFWVSVKTHAHIELLHHFVDDVDGTHRLGGERIQSEAFGESEYLAGLLLVPGDPDVATRGGDAVFAKVFAQRLDLVVPQVETHLGGVRGAQSLAREKLDDLTSGFRCFFDGLVDGEFAEGVGLGADVERRLWCGTCPEAGDEAEDGDEEERREIPAQEGGFHRGR
ncbi:MAG: hypothetical protein RLZZ399_794 [Verrucomicrobiota bacterium]